MQSGTYLYKLTEDEVLMLGYELSTDFLQKQVSIMQEKVNRVYKNLIKIAKYLTTSKNDSGSKKYQSLEVYRTILKKPRKRFFNLEPI